MYGWLKNDRVKFLEPINVTLPEKRAFADIIKDLEIRRSPWITQMGPKSIARQRGYFRQIEEEKIHKSEGDNGATETGIGMMYPQAKEYLEPSKAGGGRKDVPAQTSKTP